MVDSRAFGRRGPRIPHLVQAGKGGLAGEVADLRADVEAACHYIETTLQPMVLEEFTNLAAADTDAFKTAAATSASIQTFTVDDLDGVVGAAEVSPPRNATITSSTHANIDAVAVVITGYVRDDRGDLIAQTDTITLTDGGGATDVGTKAFSKITGISVPAQGGTGGTLAFGFGDVVGLSKKIRTAAGYQVRTLQVTDGAAVTTGTFTSNAPNGTWSPATAPNGAHDYAILYAADMRS